uniref:G protein-coupled receptor 8 n=1 Tax=Elephant endotheliotropic herpesvirus 1A TaxID=759753 RepID=A0A1L3HP15_ELHV1|nr:G protein-coupled receptor 8 [Elephant endotheliotropic herpesvirus 1A]AYF58526.1 G protein-coupled receptor 8A' [Elephant endotheliotropic herpesvirus 1A]
MNLTELTSAESPEIDACILSFSILGIIGTIYAIIQLTLAYIRKTCLCIPENTWYLHFLLLMGILNLFISSCISGIFEHVGLCFTQFSPAICVCCILTLATNLFFLCIYRQNFSSTFLLILPVLLVFPIVILLILFYSYKDNNQSCTYNYVQYALTSIYLYLDYFITISTILTLCLHKTLYGKLLCLATWTSWILWNINWSIFCPYIPFFVTLYFCPTFGYILLLFYIYPILLSKYLHTLPLMTNQLTLWCSAPPPVTVTDD